MSKKKVFLALTMLCILLSGCAGSETVSETDSEEVREEQPSDITFVIDFENDNQVVSKEINFTEMDNIGNYINISTPKSIQNPERDIEHTGKAAVFDIKTVSTDHDNWWIAGLHLNPEWGKKEFFQYTKRITFDFYSEVEYPLVTDDYGFSIELAFKVKLEDGVTDADWICLTVPFGIPETDGKWMRGTIQLDELTTYMFYGLEEDIDGNEVEVDYALEWLMIGPTWDVDSEIWDSTGRGRFAIDNIHFHTTLDESISEVPPETGELQVVVTEIKEE